MILTQPSYMPFDFTPKNLTPEELKRKEEEFRVTQIDRGIMDDLWVQLDGYFRNASIEEDKKYRDTYFRWYTSLTWQTINSKDVDFFVDMAIGRQISTALLLDFDVWRKIMHYLAINAGHDFDVVTNLFRRMKQSYFTSQQYLGSDKGADVTLSVIAAEIQKIERENADSLVFAEQNSRVQRIVFPKDIALDHPLYVCDPTIFSKRLLDLTSFFIGVPDERIYYVVDAFQHPQLYKEKKVTEDSVSPSLPPTENPYISLQQDLVVQFPISPDGQFVQVEAVLDHLEQLASATGDDRIRDLYVFNENTGKFEWNQQLLSQ